MRIHLIRHGQTAPEPPNSFYGGSEVPLSAVGQQQATEAARLLSHEALDCIISSPLKRAMFGAEQIQMRHTKLDISVCDGFREIDRGRWVGHDLESLKQTFPGDWRAYLKDPLNWNGNGGESINELRSRVLASFTDIANGEQRNIAVVAHLFPIRSILSSIRQQDVVDDMLNLSIATASVTTIFGGSGLENWQIERMGHVPY